MEFQDEEREVILSIYDGDPAFKQISPTSYQYKYGEEGEPKCFLLEINWGENYPEEKPKINLDTFFNRHIKDTVKAKITEFILNEAEQLLGSPMTYTLFECLKDKYEELFGDDKEAFAVEADVRNSDDGEEDEDDDDYTESDSEDDDDDTDSPKKVKKVHLTKAQKRKQWDRLNSKGERPRGWDWIDVIHHLSQTGPKEFYIPDTS